jgi:hypothetical protein
MRCALCTQSVVLPLAITAAGVDVPAGSATADRTAVSERTPDGSCNNLTNPTGDQTGTPHLRARYPDGAATPVRAPHPRYGSPRPCNDTAHPRGCTAHDPRHDARDPRPAPAHPPTDTAQHSRSQNQSYWRPSSTLARWFPL